MFFLQSFEKIEDIVRRKVFPERIKDAVLPLFLKLREEYRIHRRRM